MKNRILEICLISLSLNFSTKLESTDVYIPQERAQQIAGLNDTEMKNLHELVRVLAYRLRDLFSKSICCFGMGSWNLPLPRKMNKGNRAFQLVDSIGPDELRLTYDGVQLSKECLRKPYRGSDWHSVISQAKSLAKERGVQNWKRICVEELGYSPEPLSKDFLGLISSMYTSLSNAISQDLYGRAIFPDSPDIAEVAQRLQEE